MSNCVGDMFVYYYVLVPESFEVVEPSLLGLLDGAPDFGEVAYRKGEELRSRLEGGAPYLAKTVRVSLGRPVRSEHATVIPLTWEATGAPGLFPRMDAEIVLASLGPDLTHLAFQGTYRAPLGRLGRAVDRALLHRVAETSVKGFVDRVAVAIQPSISTGEALGVARGIGAPR